MLLQQLDVDISTRYNAAFFTVYRRKTAHRRFCYGSVCTYNTLPLSARYPLYMFCSQLKLFHCLSSDPIILHCHSVVLVDPYNFSGEPMCLELDNIKEKLIFFSGRSHRSMFYGCLWETYPFTPDLCDSLIGSDSLNLPSTCIMEMCVRLILDWYNSFGPM